MPSLTRRDFLTTLGAAGVALGASGWLASRLFAMVEEGALPAPRSPGVQRWVPTLCRLCPAACGIRVRLVDGLPVGVEGNRSHPVSAGGLCPAGFAALQELVHPDRLRTPLRRDGPRGSGRWTAISWDEALDRLATALRRLRAEGRPQALAVLERGDSPLTRFWVSRVLRSFGSPNLITAGPHEAWRSAWAYVAGAPNPPAPDLAGSDFILSLGHELFETEGHPVWQSKVWGRLRDPVAARAVTLAYAGPRISPSAARADLRLAIRPGTEGIMALGLVGILAIEGLLDRSFIERWTRGYDDRTDGAPRAHGGFESFIRARFHPEETSRWTGVPVSQLFRLGRAFGTARRPVALVGREAMSGERGLSTAMAVVALNLVAGAVGRAGGYVAAASAPLDLPAPLEPDAIARRGLDAPRVDGAGQATLPVVEQSPAHLASNLSARRPYPVDVLFAHGMNPLHEWPGARAFESALAEVGLIVTMGPLADETGSFADLLLPEPSFLESWQVMPSAPGVPIEHAGLQQPVVPPLYESRAFEEVWFDLARRIGDPVAATVPEDGYAGWLRRSTAGLFRSGRGTIVEEAAEARIAGYMEARGWKPPGPATAEAFWEEWRRRGGWVDHRVTDSSPEEILGRGVERFEFWPAPLHRDLTALAGAPLPEEVMYTGGAPEEPPQGAAAVAADAYPLRLLLFDTNTLWGGRSAATPLMLEMSGFRQDVSWDSWVEVHPETARRHGVRNGERVRLESPRGSLVLRAHVAPTVPPDAVAAPRGLGRRHFGRFATGVGADPTALVPAATDPWTGAAVVAARCRLVPRVG